MRTPLAALALLLPAAWYAAPSAPFRFEPQSLPFQLEHGELYARHVPATMAGGLAVFDYDLDGRPDLFFTNGANLETLSKDHPKFRNRLFHNNPDGTFTDVTEKAGLAGHGFDSGAAVADFDNDGFPDLFLAGVHRNTLYRNNGDGTFSDITAAAGLAPKPDPQFGPHWAIAAVWGDFNNDGLLDLFVVNYLQWDFKTEPLCEYKGAADYCSPRSYKPLPNELYLNNGNRTFRDASAEWNLRAHPGKGMGGGLADYDLDGRPDLFVTNDGAYNSLFHNTGSKFEELAFQKGVALLEDGNFVSGMGLDFRDADNDGYPDIAFVALARQTFPLLKNINGREFREVTAPTGLRDLSMQMAGFGVGLFDLDNDGWKDLFVSRGDVLSRPLPGTIVEQHNTVFRNPGPTGKWTSHTADANLEARPPARHRGLAFADLDQDGRLDVITTALASPPAIPSPAAPAAAAPANAARPTGSAPTGPAAAGSGAALSAQASAATSHLGSTPAGSAAAPARSALAGSGPAGASRVGSAPTGAASAAGSSPAAPANAARPAEIWLNRSPNAGHYLDIHLVGTKSNRDAIGAIVKLTTPAGVQFNHQTSSVGYASSSYGPLHFGLGPHAKADAIEIRWPSGKIQTLTNVPADRRLTIKEE